VEEDKPVMEVNVEIDYASYKQLYNHVIKTSMYWISTALFVAALALLMFNRKTFTNSLAGSSMGLFIGLLIVLIAQLFGCRSSYRHSSLLHESYIYKFFDTHIDIQMRYHHSQVQYFYYDQAIEGKAAFLLIPANKSNYVAAQNLMRLESTCAIIPKACLTPEQIITLRNLFERQFGGKFISKIKH